MAQKEQIIYFIGSDLTYLAMLKAHFLESYESKNYIFKQAHDKTIEGLHEIISEIIQCEVKIIYIDFSDGTAEMLYLTRILRRCDSTKNISTIGLIDNTGAKKYLKECILQGLRIVHIKSSDVNDVVFDAVYLKNSKDVKKSKYATAKDPQDISIYEIVKIAYASEDHLSIKNDYDWGITFHGFHNIY